MHWQLMFFCVSRTLCQNFKPIGVKLTSYKYLNVCCLRSGLLVCKTLNRFLAFLKLAIFEVRLPHNSKSTVPIALKFYTILQVTPAALNWTIFWQKVLTSKYYKKLNNIPKNPSKVTLRNVSVSPKKMSFFTLLTPRPKNYIFPTKFHNSYIECDGKADSESILLRLWYKP